MCIYDRSSLLSRSILLTLPLVDLSPTSPSLSDHEVITHNRLLLLSHSSLNSSHLLFSSLSLGRSLFFPFPVMRSFSLVLSSIKTINKTSICTLRRSDVYRRNDTSWTLLYLRTYKRQGLLGQKSTQAHVKSSSPLVWHICMNTKNEGNLLELACGDVCNTWTSNDNKD